MSRIFGIALLLLGIYFLGQNIIFASHYYPYGWRNIPAAGSVLAIMVGIICLLFFPRQTGSFGWILLGFAVVFVFFKWRRYIETHHLVAIFCCFCCALQWFSATHPRAA